MKRSLCPHCKRRLADGERIHQECIDPWADAQAAKAQRKQAKVQRSAQKAEKAEIKARKEKAKTISALEEECRKIVQKIARIRDRNDGCISCDKPAHWGGQWHGSHYRAHGGCSSVQFHLWNIHKACWICNKLYSGRIDQYKPKLIEKIGADRVEWLDSQPKSQKFSREYLERFKQVMGKRCRRMEKRHGLNPDI